MVLSRCSINQLYSDYHKDNMPKGKDSLVDRAKKLIGSGSVFEVQSSKYGVHIYCASCKCKVRVDEVHLKSQYQSHVTSSKHNNSTVKKGLQPSIAAAIATTSVKETYAEKLAAAFLEAGIPIWKLQHPSIKKFFLDEHKEVLPTASTFYRKIDSIFNKTMQQIKDFVADRPIYLIIDETTDACKRSVLNVLVGVFGGTPSKPMLLQTMFLDKTNSTTVQQGVNKALFTLYGPNLPYEKLWLLISDQASYMLAAGKGLKQMFPNMKHVTCIVHGLNRVCELIKDRNKLVNKLIAKMKAILLKSNNRREKFAEMCNFALPPTVIESRWNSWLNGAFYYAEHFTDIKKFVLALEDKDSKALDQLKEIIVKPELEQDLFELCEYKFLTEAITKLETRGLTVKEQLNVLNDVKSKLSGDDLTKLESVLSKNPDLYFFKDMAVDEKLKALYAPLTSVDVERSFSIYRYILSDRRHSLTNENVAMLNVIQFNNFIDTDE